MASANFQPVGPAHLVIGDPTTAAGADMTHLQKVRNVSFDSGNRSAFTSADAQSGVPIADGIYTLANLAQVTAELQELGQSHLKALLLNHTETTQTADVVIGAPDSFQAVAAASVPTLAIVPVSQEGDGENAQDAIWMPAVLIQGPNGLPFSRVDEGEITQAYSVTMQGAYRSADQDSTAIPAGNRIWFSGKPSVLSLTWSLPTLT